MRRAILALLALTMPMSTFAGFNALFDGVPDLELNSLVQKNSRTFTMIVCNRGDTANELGSIALSMRGKPGKSIDRTINGVSIQANRCQSFDISSATTFGKPSDRNYDITATISWIGSRKEIMLDNNRYVLSSSVPMSDYGSVSTSPSRDLWGTSNGNWYVPSNSNYAYPSSGNGNPLNFSPAGRFYGQTTTQNGNVIYIYQNNPYAGSNAYSTFDNNGYPCYNNYHSSTNTYNTFDYVNGNDSNRYYTNCYNGNPCYGCSNSSNCNGYSNCYNYNGNCYNNGSNCYDSLPDLVVNSIRQNGSSREFAVNVCNYGAGINSGVTTDLKLNIGSNYKSVNFLTSLASNACQDVYVSFSLMDIYYSGNYTVNAYVDDSRLVRERNESNNDLSRIVTVNYN